MRPPSARPSERKAFQSQARDARIDRWFNRLGQLSQVLLLLLGVFGYFYTVLPLYQKALLDEEIAQKTIELRQKGADLEVKTREVGDLSAQITTRTQELKDRERALAAVNQGLRTAKAEKELATAKAEVAGLEAEVAYVKLRREYIGAAVNSTDSCVITAMFKGLSDEGFANCWRGIAERQKLPFGQLRPVEYPAFIKAVENAITKHSGEYSKLVGDTRAKLEPLEVEWKEIEAKFQKKSPVNSPEWNEAVNLRFGRGSAVQDQIRQIQKVATDRYKDMLQRSADAIWAEMWPKRG